MFVDATVFCKTSMLHPWLCRHYSLKCCQNTCHTRYQWLLGPFRGTFVITQKWVKKKKRILIWSCDLYVISLFSSTSLFLNQQVFWSTFFEEELCVISQPPLPPLPSARGWNCITESLFSIFFFFSAFCLLFCQGSSNPVWCFSVLKFYRGICDCVNFPSLFPSPSRKPPRNKALWLILRWKCKP